MPYREMEALMPYREKIAWLSLIAIVVTLGPYFVRAAVSPPSSELPGLDYLVLFAVAGLVQVLLIGLGRWYLRHRSPLDARTPPDERDRAIERRSVTAAYYVLIVGVIMVGVVMPFNTSGWDIINAALFAVTVAELVHYGCVVTNYRRQS
jgi:amino acid transporter